ncbi:hypothetical protein A7K91_18660 [Paenibacillus oryzae]|uniref:Uncharacterized protein n=1 Tax=Paenibacillus oryzae TaxID=1844972 RepID=A0A1A5YRB8_9BACL|nr:hypothetical protein [Paenibacillus oryzae]OBR67955.1 hypothetical protein A7K91_18660 [Paenibacillus oryzae]
MNNRSLGLYAPAIAAVCTIIFFIGLLLNHDTLNFASCLVLGWAYVLTACAYAALADPDKKAIGFGGVAIAIVYCVFTNLVYYTQLTTVKFESADPVIVKALAFKSGYWLFGFDLMGYGLMALSTALLGFSFKAASKRDRALKGMLLAHGLFFPVCIIGPMLNLFQAGGDDAAGIMALQGWCLFFTPLMLLSANRFYRMKSTIY